MRSRTGSLPSGSSSGMSKSTSTLSTGSGWHSGINSPAPLGRHDAGDRARCRALRPWALFFGDRMERRGCRRMMIPFGDRLRAVTGFAPTSTIRAWPWSSRWVSESWPSSVVSYTSSPSLDKLCDLLASASAVGSTSSRSQHRRGVALGVLRIGMAFEEQSIDACGDRGAREHRRILRIAAGLIAQAGRAAACGA